ncbi:Methionine--tRNA ligase [uncultured archaeon]|nr:Methionine--tRNA ligase [uncultured archaeon]
MTEEQSQEIEITDFAKIELRIGLIENAEKLDSSKKLLKLTVDFGEKGKRTIFSGIAEYYTPEQIIGKKVAFLFNIKPRTMSVGTSQGMILMAEDSTTKAFSLVIPEKDLPQGSKLS